MSNKDRPQDLVILNQNIITLVNQSEEINKRFDHEIDKFNDILRRINNHVSTVEKLINKENNRIFFKETFINKLVSGLVVMK